MWRFPFPSASCSRCAAKGVTADSVLVRLKLPDGSTYAHDGAIQFAEVEGNAGTDTITVRADIPNPDRLLVDRRRRRQRAVEEARTQTHDVPGRAPAGSAGAYVLLVTPENKVETRRIVVGEQHGPLIVVKSSLSEGTGSSRSGQQKVRPGITVEATEIKEDVSAEQ